MSLKDKQKLRGMKSDVFKRIATIDFIEIYIPTEFVVAVDKKKTFAQCEFTRGKNNIVTKKRYYLYHIFTKTYIN